MTPITGTHRPPGRLLGAALGSIMLAAALLSLPAGALAGAATPARHRPAAHHGVAHHGAAHHKASTTSHPSAHKKAGHKKAVHKKATAARLLPRSTVIARDLARHTLVVVGKDGVARTLRLTKARQVRGTRLGTVVVARAVHLADGTYRLVRMSRHGHRRLALVRATVVDTTTRALLLSAGGSVFAVRDPKPVAAHVVLAHAATASPSTAPPASPSTGELVRAKVDITGASLNVAPAAITPLGQAGLVSLQGVLQAVTGTALTIAVSQGAITTVTIPPSISLPSTIAAGDQVEILAAYANGAFTLVTIRDDKLAATATSQGVTQPAAGSARHLEVEGVVKSVSGSTVVIQPGDGAAPVTVAVPATVGLAGITAGSQIHVAAGMSQGTLTAVRVHLQRPEGGDHGSASKGPGHQNGSDGSGGNGGSNSSSTGSDHQSGDHSGGDGGGSSNLTGTATTFVPTTTTLAPSPTQHHGDGGDGGGNNGGGGNSGGGDN